MIQNYFYMAIVKFQIEKIELVNKFFLKEHKLRKLREQDIFLDLHYMEFINSILKLPSRVKVFLKNT